MFFTDREFFIFLPVVLCLYWLVPHRAQNLLLLVASYFFYAYAVPWTGWLMAAVTLINYTAAILIERYQTRRVALAVLCIALSLTFLLWFKYALFILRGLSDIFPALPVPLEIFLPAGISFFTFQALAYTGDVYTGRLKAERNPVDFFLFVSFFPQLVAGPIERAENLLRQVTEQRRWQLDRFMRGLDILCLGYVKKIVIADNVAIYVNMIFDLKNPSALMILAGAIGFGIQILADFSSYTDIARGCGRFMGFELMENFNHPYLARSPGEFWRRWHISLSNLIKEYLYVPLGGSRVNPGRWVFNIVLVWFICGLWHGAGWNFIIWGLYWGMLLIAYRYITLFPEKPWADIPKIVIFFTWTTLGWLLFRVRDLSLLSEYFSPNAFARIQQQLPVTAAVLFIFLLYAAPLVLTLCLEKRAARAMTTWHGQMAVRMAGYTCAALLLVLFAAEQGSDFYYFQF